MPKQNVADISKPKESVPALKKNSQTILNESGISKTDLIKIDIEREKVKVERNKLLVSVLVEDFKARWQELLNFENENSRWQTLYVTALILVVSWVLSNSGEAAKFKNIGDIFHGENSYLVLCLALINAVYTLAMAYKGYQIQEIAQYLVVKVGNQISTTVGGEFNEWERWRRTCSGGPSYITKIYYTTVGMLPTAVSATILILFYGYEYRWSINSWSLLNIFFYFVSSFVFATLVTAFLTTRKNAEWKKILGLTT